MMMMMMQSHVVIIICKDTDVVSSRNRVPAFIPVGTNNETRCGRKPSDMQSCGSTPFSMRTTIPLLPSPTVGMPAPFASRSAFDVLGYFVFFCFHFCCFRIRFPTLQNLLAQTPRMCCSAFIFVSFRWPISQADPVSIPFHSFRFHCVLLCCVVLRCLSHKQFPLIRGTQPSGTIRREPTNKSTTHTVTLILRHDSEGTIQSSSPIQWTNQPINQQPTNQPTNRLLRHDSVETFDTTRTYKHRPTTLTLISIATPSGTIRREPDAILGGQSLPIHSFIQTSFLVGTMVRFCLSVRTHIHTHTNNPQYRASPVLFCSVPFFSALSPLLSSPPQPLGGTSVP